MSRNMLAAPLPLRGRDAELAEVMSALQAGQSVLLFGPEAVGKSAIARTVASANILLLDPFEHVSGHRAHRVLHWLDQGRVAVATSRTRRRSDIGAVGRVLWRFTPVRVEPLSRAWIRQILWDILGLALHRSQALPSSWWSQAIAASRGRPGYAAAIATGTARALDASGRVPSPHLVLLDARLEWR